MWLASFDIWKKNFAFCIEEVNTEILQTVEPVPARERYYKDGTSTIEFANVLRKVYGSGKIMLLDNVDLTVNTDTTQYLDPQVFIAMTRLLDTYKEYWDKCSTFIVEQQMGFGKRRNYMALKLGQHCISYFLIHYANFKQVVEYPAYNKTKVLGAGKKLSKHQRKMWAIHKAMEVLTEMDDDSMVQKIQSRKKRDDLGDVIVQLQSYKFLCFVDK